MPNAPVWDELLRGNAVNIWYTILVKKMRNRTTETMMQFDLLPEAPLADQIGES